MKKLLFTACLLTLSATAAMAQGAPGTGHQGQDFAARKAEIVQKIQQRLSCVQAAASPEALRACLPEHGQHKGHGAPGSESNASGGVNQ